MIEVSGIPISLDAMLSENGVQQKAEVARALGVKPKALRECILRRKSVDARKKSNVHFTTTFACMMDDDQERCLLEHPPKGLQIRIAKSSVPLSYPSFRFAVVSKGRRDDVLPAADACEEGGAILRDGGSAPNIVVVGLGPAGLFAALYLARCGLHPVVVERGYQVDRRARDIELFNKTGELKPHSNIQFGEGGAGTFSDGKLTTNIKSSYARHVLHWFVEAGAPESILVDSHPHLGSDELPGIVSHMRKEVIALGGDVRFATQLIDWRFNDGAVSSVVLRDIECDEVYELPATHVVLACGHSARDVFELCKRTGFRMEQKPFSVGVRIEHLQERINRAQWGGAADHPALGAAEYKLAVHLPSGRSVYTFCMCPGGEVVAAASEEGGVVTNGMSCLARDGKNANAALLVNVDPRDFADDDVLAGVRLQRQIEQAAFLLAQRYNAEPYQAPSQRVGVFLEQWRRSRLGEERDQDETDSVSEEGFVLSPTYGRGVFEAPLSECLPEFVVDSLAQALPRLGRKLAGFDDPEAIMTAPETRSSSPVRICRGKNLQASFSDQAKRQTTKERSADGCDLVGSADQDENACGIYPCGEGPGYAGGIMSAACDGLRVAQRIADSLLEAQDER